MEDDSPWGRCKSGPRTIMRYWQIWRKRKRRTNEKAVMLPKKHTPDTAKSVLSVTSEMGITGWGATYFSTTRKRVANTRLAPNRPYTRGCDHASSSVFFKLNPRSEQPIVAACCLVRKRTWSAYEYWDQRTNKGERAKNIDPAKFFFDSLTLHFGRKGYINLDSDEDYARKNQRNLSFHNLCQRESSRLYGPSHLKKECPSTTRSHQKKA